MTIHPMPPAEVVIEPSLVRDLLTQQHPDLAPLPLTPVGNGWDNQLYRLGDDLLVRLPRRSASAPLIEHEWRWLPELARRLPLDVPVPRRRGRPGCGYPWAWTVTSWQQGNTWARRPPDDLGAAARRLGAFLGALHTPAPSDAPPNPYRGIPLAQRSATVQERLTQLGDQVDAVALSAIWDSAVRAPGWPGPPLWIHGDLHPSNLVVRGGRLSAVIDFGDLTAGDPATDLAVAWMLFPPPERVVLRRASREQPGGVDDATWARARGWAMALGLVFLGTSQDAPDMGAIGRDTLERVVEEARDGHGIASD